MKQSNTGIRGSRIAAFAMFLVSASTAVAQGKVESSKEKAAEKPAPNVVYHCRHEGVETYTNTKLNKACKATVLGPVVTSAAVKSPAVPAVSGQQPGFPSVTEATQKSRDVDRRRILEEELAAEQKNLEAAKKDLEAQSAKAAQEEKSYQKIIERLQPFKEKLGLHERNLQALKKEISALPKP